MLEVWMLTLALCQTGPLYNTPMYETSFFASGLELEDLNGDGFLDLVNGSYSGLDRRLGDGAGGFSPMATFPCGACRFVEISDYDADGKPDALTVSGGWLSLARGDGAGGFLAPSTWTFNGTAQGLVVGDVDLDGDLDAIVTTLLGSHTVVLGRNDGGGAFTLVTSPAGYGLSCLDLADMTGDGIPDVIGGSSIGSNVVVLKGDGAGVFATMSITPTNTAPIDAIEVADVDLDGDQDVVVQINSDHMTFLGDGTGNLHKVASGPGGGEELRVEDLTGDGVPDLISASGIFEGSGIGSFGAPISILATSGWEIEPGDLNGDGRVDLATLGLDRVTLAIQDGLGRFGGGSYAFPEVSFATGSALFDVDDDSDLDGVLALEPKSTELLLYRNDGAGGFAFSSWITLPTDPNPNPSQTYWYEGRIYHADVNGDGRGDLIVPRSKTTSVGLSNGSGDFSAWNSVSGTGDPFFVDVDGDGNLDLALQESPSGVVSLHQGDGMGTFSPKGAVPGPWHWGFGTHALFADMNGDGKQDLVIAAYGGVDVWIGDGAFGFPTVHHLPMPGSPGTDDIHAADYDADGLMDLSIIKSVNFIANLIIVRGSASGAFTISGTYPFSDYAALDIDQVARDLDSDGDLDIVASTFDNGSRISILSNDGSAGFTLDGTFGLGPNVRNIRAEDLDGDGDIDIAGSQLDILYRNNSTPPCSGAFAEYGQGCPGWGKFVPHLSGYGCPTSGEIVRIRVTGGSGGASAMMFFGASAAALPLGYGCSLLLGGVVPWPLAIPLNGAGPGTGQFETNAWLPAGITPGTQAFMQVFVPDTTVPAGFAASNALQMTVQ